MSIVLGALILILCALLFIVVRDNRGAAADFARWRAELETLRTRNADLERAARELGTPREIVDAEAQARAMRDAALHESDEIKARAQALQTSARNTADSLRAEAEQILVSAKAESDGRLVRARQEAERILSEARARAEATAGDAMRALENVDQLQRTATALKNIVDGYGDSYVMPTTNLLDELADEFGHLQAGQQLKDARDRTKALIKAGQAATCDYVEENRRDTAIAFVLDAFNGKVDSILSQTKLDNFGTLSQKIKDAWALVNQNGKAFRDARITEPYLAARLEELRLGIIAHELKQKEREEQRVIRERIREEERAQREFERAIKDAQKEEEIIRKAMEKARREAEQAGEAKRAELDAKLAELEEKLREAEQKNQRAMSMAQQTRSGHVYVISNVGSFGEDVYKIGLTRRLEPLERIKELGDASVPFDFDVHAMIASADAPTLERELHRRFVRWQVNKVNGRKEFFRVPLRQIREEVERLGSSVHWTMAAECREYKETMAIERQLEVGGIEVQRWAERQLAESEAAPVDSSMPEVAAAPA